MIQANDVSTDFKQDYERNGFLVVPQLLTREECGALKAEGKRVLEKNASAGASVFVGVAAASDVYYRLASDKRLVDVLRVLMPGGVMFLSDKFVWKSGELRFPTPWHQDAAYWPGTRPKLSVWIALDDVDGNNGALKVLPGGHQAAVKHGAGGVEGEFGQVIKEMPQNAPGEVVAEMAMGSALFFSDLLPHASCANNSGQDRYAIISTYHAPAPDDFFDVTLPARHVIVPQPEH